MCTVCGCGHIHDDEVSTDLSHHDNDSHHHTHPHEHNLSEKPDGTIHFGDNPAGTHIPGLSAAQTLKIERDILSKNDSFAKQNRQWLEDRSILTLNLISSPGSGKTSLLVHTIEAIKTTYPIAVIEGDQQSSRDAERIKTTGIPAIQINTGKGCHLDAHMVGHAIMRLAPSSNGILFIENVGNLVCPAAFDLGESYRVAMLSVTEGDDKPLKYPDIFATADLLLITKTDLLPYVDFDSQRFTDYVRRINTKLEIIQLSVRTGQGVETWLQWLENASRKLKSDNEKKIAGLKQRIATLEAALSHQSPPT